MLKLAVGFKLCDRSNVSVTPDPEKSSWDSYWSDRFSVEILAWDLRIWILRREMTAFWMSSTPEFLAMQQNKLLTEDPVGLFDEFIQMLPPAETTPQVEPLEKLWSTSPPEEPLPPESGLPRPAPRTPEEIVASIPAEHLKGTAGTGIIQDLYAKRPLTLSHISDLFAVLEKREERVETLRFSESDWQELMADPDTEKQMIGDALWAAQVEKTGSPGVVTALSRSWTAHLNLDE
jgi:hypothetical protein